MQTGKADQKGAESEKEAAGEPLGLTIETRPSLISMEMPSFPALLVYGR
jgi:hypothetical protein